MLMVGLHSNYLSPPADLGQLAQWERPWLLQMRMLAILFSVVSCLFRPETARHARTNSVLCLVILACELSLADSSLAIQRAITNEVSSIYILGINWDLLYPYVPSQSISYGFSKRCEMAAKGNLLPLKSDLNGSIYVMEYKHWPHGMK